MSTIILLENNKCDNKDINLAIYTRIWFKICAKPICLLSDYKITSGNGVTASASGNNLTITITSENYDNQITFKKIFSARDVNIIYGTGGIRYVEVPVSW